jgi:hypothetical protein
MSNAARGFIGCLAFLALCGVTVLSMFACCGGLGVVGLQEAAKQEAQLAARPKASEELQQQRKALIDKYRDAGMFVRIEVPGDVPHVFVDPVAWSLIDIEDKEAFAGVVAAYHYGLDKGVIGDAQDTVRFFDRTTGKAIASYSPPLGIR